MPRNLSSGQYPSLALTRALGLVVLLLLAASLATVLALASAEAVVSPEHHSAAPRSAAPDAATPRGRDSAPTVVQIGVTLAGKAQQVARNDAALMAP